MPAYKNKERKTWFVSFWFVDWQGNRKRKKKEGFRTRAEALLFEQNFQRQQSGDPQMRFADLVEIYLEDCSSRLRETTMSTKRYLVEKKILPVLGEMQLSDITPAVVRKFQNGIISDTRDFAPTYMKTINNQLSAIFNFAVKYYNLPKNPVKITGSIGKKNAEEMHFWTLDEFNQFLQAVSDKPASRVMFTLLFWTGIRSGELLALTANDFDGLSMSISKSYTRLNKTDVIDLPKTPKSKRVIRLPEFVADMVRAYLVKLPDYQPDYRIFNYTKYYLNHEMQRGCKLSGTKKIRVHDLRHSHASLLIQMGFSPLLISERLGHESVETTLNTYSHLYPNAHEDLANQLDNLGTNKKNLKNGTFTVLR